jgi:hypothetical protein
MFETNRANRIQNDLNTEIGHDGGSLKAPHNIHGDKNIINSLTVCCLFGSWYDTVMWIIKKE